MRCLRCWVPAAAALLLLSAAGVNMEHLQAQNLHLLPPDEHILVRNREMRGIYFHFPFDLSFCCLSQ